MPQFSHAVILEDQKRHPGRVLVLSNQYPRYVRSGGKLSREDWIVEQILDSNLRAENTARGIQNPPRPTGFRKPFNYGQSGKN